VGSSFGWLGCLLIVGGTAYVLSSMPSEPPTALAPTPRRSFSLRTRCHHRLRKARTPHWSGPNIFATVVVAKWMGELDDEKAREALSTTGEVGAAQPVLNVGASTV